MAVLTPLDDCLEARRGILFDTSALIGLFQTEQLTGRLSPLLLRIPPLRRFTSPVAWAEFLCNIPRELHERRIAWLADKQIRIVRFDHRLAASFTALAQGPLDCALIRDLLIAATAMSGNLAVAAEDPDFGRIPTITTVAEFVA